MSPLLKMERSSQGVFKISDRGVGVEVAVGLGVEHEARGKLRLNKEMKSFFIN
jgi:hypothetical protein